MDRKPITLRANGKWKNILIAVGIDAKALDGKHHPCPCTGEGEDRFRFSNKDGKGSFFCGCNNGRGDGFKLIECKLGKGFKEAAVMVEKIVDDLEPDDRRNKRNAADALRDLKKIQKAITLGKRDGSRVLNYLRGRGIYLPKLPASMYEGCINYGLHAVNEFNDQVAMVSKFVDVDGKPVTLHITYLDENDRKAGHKRSRVIMTPAAAMAGGAVRLSPMGEEGVLGVAEGIENALAASILHKVPVWACLNAAMLEVFKPPKGCKKLVVFADNDSNFTGQAAAFALAKRASLVERIESHVLVPDAVGMDYNDVLRGTTNGN
jgi:putative DNA primase/helicase